MEHFVWYWQHILTPSDSTSSWNSGGFGDLTYVHIAEPCSSRSNRPLSSSSRSYSCRYALLRHRSHLHCPEICIRRHTWTLQHLWLTYFGWLLFPNLVSVTLRKLERYLRHLKWNMRVSGFDYKRRSFANQPSHTFDWCFVAQIF